MPSERAEKIVLAATYPVLAGVGFMSAVLEAFLVPLRLPHGLEGLAAVLAFVGNLAIGTLGGLGTKRIAGAITPIFAWFLTAGVIALYAPGGDVILPGTVPGDPGIGWVTNAFFLGGILAGAISLVLTVRFTTQRIAPTSPV